MKTYTCDICKKEFGYNVSYSITDYAPYKASTPRTDADICFDCFNKIAKAQEETIRGLKNKYDNTQTETL